MIDTPPRNGVFHETFVAEVFFILSDITKENFIIEV